MIRSKRITVISILAVMVSIVSLVSSSVALSATMDHGVSSVMSPNLNNSASLDFNVYLGKDIEVETKESCVMINSPLIQENSILFSYTTQEKENEFDFSFSIINEGDVDGVISSVSVDGLPEGVIYQIEGIKKGTSISKKSRIGVILHLTLIDVREDVILEPLTYDSIQISFSIQK